MILPKAPAAPPPFDWAHLATRGLEALQDRLDVLVLSSTAIGWGLLAFAALLVVLGRQGQRVLSGVLIGGTLALAALYLLPGGEGLAWVPAACALIGAGLGLLLGLVAPAWGTAFGLAAALGAAGGLAAQAAGLLAVGGYAPGAGLGLFLGLSKQRTISVLLPPLAAALALALGGANLWASATHGGVLPELGEVRWVLALFAASAALLLALSIARDRRALRREEAARIVTDEELQRRVDRHRARTAGAGGAGRMSRVGGPADAPPEDASEPGEDEP